MPTKSAQKSSPLRHALRRRWREASWKTVQHGKKVKQKTKLALLVLVLIVLLFLAGQAFRVVNGLFQPTTKDMPKKEYSWDSSSNINLVIKGSEIAVLSYNPHESSVVIVQIPQESYLTVTGGLGSWQLRAIYDLGGSALLRSSLSLFLGIPIDGFLESLDVIKLIRSNPWQITSSLSGLKTDLTPIELTRLLWGLRGVRFDKVKTIDLAQENILERSHLADGTPIYTADQAQIDAISVNFVESKIVNERYSIAIFNTTWKQGLAGKAGRVITNIGGDVIVTSVADEPVKSSFVYVDDKSSNLKSSYTYARLKNIFGEVKGGSGCQKEPNCSIIPAEVKDSRAQINVVLGEDYIARLE